MDIGALGVYFSLFIGLYFEVFLLISFLERHPTQKTPQLPTHYPRVSMLVPVWNEEKTIATTLESLLALDYPQDKLEVLVIDDGSTDKTRTVTEHYIAQLPQQERSRVRMLHKENGGKWTALNMGIEHSTSELIGCLDADSFVAPDALLEMIKKFENDHSVMAISPAMKVFRPKKLLELMQAVEYTFGIFYKKMFDNLAALNVLPGPFSMYRREVFTKIGLFKHAHNTEDMEIAFRMHSRGLKIVNAHTAFVYTTVPSTLRTLIKQRVRWSQGFLQNSQDYSYMYFNPRFGNFGMLILPFGLTALFAGLYTAFYALFHLVSYVGGRALDMWVTRIPPHLPTFSHFDWFYLNTSMLTFLIVATLLLTFLGIMLGQGMAQTRLSAKSFLSYFALFGFVAPVWLARAVWGAVRSKESSWR